MKRALKSSEFGNSDLNIICVMEDKKVHAYLHKKNRELVPKFSAVLKEMKDDGMIEEYRNIANKETSAD